MTKISSLTALTGAGVDTAADLFPIVDMSEAGSARNKKITIDETRIALGVSSADSPQFTAINLGHASDTTIARVSAGVVAVEGVNIVTTAGGVTFSADIVVPAEAYGVGWNGSNEVPTKNDLYDKIETIAAGSGIDVEDEGTPEASGATTLNFVGAGVTAADMGGGVVDVTIPGGGVSDLGDLSDVDTTGQTSGDVLTYDGAEWVPQAPSGGGTPSGTSFPGSPTTDDKFYRSDRHIEYYYDGTRWLSTQIHSLTFTTDGNATVSADTSFYSAIPFKGLYDIYLERLDVSGWRSAAGEWDFLLQTATGTGTYTTIITIDGSGHPTTTWFAGSATHNAVLTSSVEGLRLTLDEVSGTASFLGSGYLTFRLVG